ncbi:potassium transporter KefB [Hymenobacter sp. BT730]|uniref:potassium transporter KefB n=1 Tax=Hymenobacter sp. BT730 TaxID=3063332 RepID=UPI0026E078C5|nr:potassium transporter KefB [Hymenobacter sp. BT730]
MTPTINSPTQPIHQGSLSKRMLQGAAIALVCISLFIIPAGWFTQVAKPEWGKLWMIKPFLVVPIAGALGGVFYYFMDHLRYQGGWKKALAYVISLLGYLVVLWLGTVLGLNGTWWD